MALTDNGMGAADLAAIMGSNNNGFMGNDGAWWLLILLFALGGNGFGFGGWNNGAMMGAFDGFGLYPWMNQNNQINDGFRDQMLNTQISSIGDKVSSGFGDVQLGIAGINQNLCQTGNGVVNALNSGFANAETAANARQMADMQQGFNAQVATMQGFNGLQGQLAQCCCDDRLATANLSAMVQAENCADRAAVSDGIRDVITAGTANTQALLNAVKGLSDQMCQDKIDAKNDTIAQLRSELMYARGQASQDVQTAAIQAGQRALANEVEQYVAPRPIPSYTVASPYCCQQNYGCGCGVA